MGMHGNMSPFSANKSISRSERKLLLDNSDYGFDMRTWRRSKRRRLFSDGVNLESSSYTSDEISGNAEVGTNLEEDYDYKVFLEILREDGNAEFEDNDAVVSEDDDDVDPDYKLFLDNLKEDGKSFVYELKRENGTVVCVKYGGEDVPDEVMLEPHIGVNISSQRGRSFVIKEEVKLESLTPDCQRKSISSNKRTHGEAIHQFLHDGESPIDLSTIDESYYAFLSNIRIDGDSLTLVYENVVVKYDEDIETVTDSKGSVTESASNFSERKITPNSVQKSFSSPMDEDDDCCIEITTGSNVSDFKKRLMANIGRPFNQEEYEKLLKDVTTKKPKEGSKDLRSVLKSYSKEQKSPSYLERFPDFEKQLKFVLENCDSALYLLRGFFFWLENITHEGAFMPWLDDSCLEMMPGPTLPKPRRVCSRDPDCWEV